MGSSSDRVMIVADPHLKTKDQFGDTDKNGYNTRTIHKIKEIKELIQRENIAVLIIAGDTFHTSNPAEWVRSYFFNNIPKLLKN